MTNPKIQAANDIMKFAGTFRSFIALADELTDVGSLEQARDEAKARLSDLESRIAKRNAEYDAERLKRSQEFEAQKQQAADYLAKEKALAETVSANAKEAAGKMLAEAHAEAKVIIDEARAMAGGHLAAANEHKAALAKAKVEYADVQRDRDIAVREHNSLRDAIAALKAKF